MPMRIASSKLSNLLILIILLPSVMHAAEYKLSQSYSLSGRYDDNYRNLVDSSTVSERDLSGGSISMSGLFSRGTPRSDASAYLRINRGEFSDDSYSTTTGSFKSNADLRYARGSITASLDANRTTQRVSVTDLDLIDSEPFRATDAFQIQGDLGGEYAIGSKTQGSINFSMNNESYDADQFTDNTQRGVKATLGRSFTERWGGSLSVSYDRTKLNDDQSPTELNPALPLIEALACATESSSNTDRTTDIDPLLQPFACFKQFDFEDSERDSYQAILSVSYRFSENLFISLGAGPRRSESLRKLSIVDVPGAIIPEPSISLDNESNQDSLALDISANYVLEKSQYSVAASTRDRVNSRGSIETLNTYEVKAARDFTSRFSTNVQLTFREFEFDTQVSSVPEDRENLLADIELRYDLIPGLTNVGLKYGYEEQNQFGIDRLIVENEIGVDVEHFFSRDRRNGGFSVRIEYQNFEREFKFSDSDSNRQQVRLNLVWTPRLISYSR